jgi:hypothetical protein
MISCMEPAKTINTQISLPVELYEAIVRRAGAYGHSVSGEIVSLLTPVLMPVPSELEREFADWEAASDEDWLMIEELLTSADN